MIEIQLTRGKVALIDDEDAHLARFRWFAYRDSHIWYARRTVYRPQQRTLLLHREILGICDPAIKIDHRNGDGLDCRRENLRTATAAENGLNCRIGRNSTSGFKGVTRIADAGKWQARIYTQGRAVYLGWHKTAEDAARAYDDAARKAFGSFACLNFPRPGERDARAVITIQGGDDRGE